MPDRIQILKKIVYCLDQIFLHLPLVHFLT